MHGTRNGDDANPQNGKPALLMKSDGEKCTPQEGSTEFVKFNGTLNIED